MTIRCDEVKRIVEPSARTTWPADVAAHLAACDDCLQGAIADALATPPAAAVAPEFASRLIARLPHESHARLWPRWPVVAAAALSIVILFAGLWLLLVDAGAPQREIWAVWYWAAFLVAAGESAVLIACTWEAEPS